MPLASQEIGQGSRPLVLLHGFLGSGRNLATFARRWSAQDPTLRLVLPDLTGHGSSPPLPPGAELRTIALDLLELVRPLAQDGAVPLIGHSLGGRVALAALDVAPELIRSVDLLDIAPGPIRGAAAESDRILARVVAAPATAASRTEVRAFLLEGGLHPAIADWVLMNLVAQNGGYGWRIDRQALAEFRPRMNGADLWPVVERFGERIRCVRGGDSRYVRDDDVQRLEAAGGVVATLPGAGHFVHVDQPEELLRTLAGWHRSAGR